MANDEELLESEEDEGGENLALDDLLRDDIERNDEDEVFDVYLRGFDAFSLAFVKDLMAQFKTFVKDFILDWSSQTLMLRVSR